MTVVATLSGVLRLDDSDFRGGIQRGRDEMQGFGQRLRSVGQDVQNFGQNMTVATAPIAAYLGSAVVATHQFDRNMSNVNSILGSTNEEAATLRAELLAYGSGTVAGPMAVSDAYYAIVSGVQDASTHMAILDASTRTAEAGQADLQSTTSALITTMNAYGFSADDAAYVSDVFTRTVQMGVLEMDDLASAFPDVVSLTSQFGIGVDEAASSLAFLTTQNSNASQSATYLRGMVTTLLNPTTELSTAITSLGYESGAALLEAEGLAGSYSLLSEQNGGLDGLITNQEALLGAIGLTQDGAQTFFDNYASGIDGATDRSGAIQDQTEQWDLLMSGLQGVSIQIGSALMPVLMDLVTNYISPAVSAVSAWISANPELTSQIVMLGAALVVAGPIITAIGIAIGFILSPIGLVAVAIAGLGAIFVEQSGGMENAWLRVQGMLAGAWAIISPTLENIYDWFVVTGLPAAQAFIVDTAIPAIESFIGIVMGIWEDVSPGLGSLFDWFITGGLPLMADVVTATFGPALDVIIGTMTGIWETVSPYLGDLYDWFMVDGLAGIETYLSGPFTTAFQGFIDFISAIWDVVQPGLQAFQDGVGGVFTWILDNSIGPVSDALASAWTAYSDFTSWSGNAMTGAGNWIDGMNPFTNNQQNRQNDANDATTYANPNANGGEVSQGQAYLVGEREPELFVPRESGTILNQEQMAGQGGGGFNISGVTIYANSEQGGRDAARGLYAEMQELMRGQGVRGGA